MESRTEKITVSVTPSEKMAAEYVAGMEGVAQSELLHRMSVAQVVELFEGSDGFNEHPVEDEAPAAYDIGLPSTVELMRSTSLTMDFAHREDGRTVIAEIVGRKGRKGFEGFRKEWTLDLLDAAVSERAVAAVSACVPAGTEVTLTARRLVIGPMLETSDIDVDAIIHALVDVADEGVPA